MTATATPNALKTARRVVREWAPFNIWRRTPTRTRRTEGADNVATHYVVAYKGEDGERRYWCEDEWVGRWGEEARVMEFPSASRAAVVAEQLNAKPSWSGYNFEAVEVQCDHETGAPFVWRTVPRATAA